MWYTLVQGQLRRGKAFRDQVARLPTAVTHQSVAIFFAAARDTVDFGASCGVHASATSETAACKLALS
jgi:hypothetical protein